MAETTVRSAIAAQLGGAFDMLENAIRACPDSVWGDEKRNPQYWYLAFHTIFFADLYLSESEKEFAPPAPYTLSEFDPSGLMPDRVYTRDELLSYLEHDRRKLRGLLAEWSEERAREPRAFGSIQGTLLEVLLYNLRHVQHHAAQLNLILRRETNSAPKWVVRAKS